ncbi:protein draper-like, partial [Saccostrea cucullata]|uniref:protein draper-like n=1 Tax=Saccostrea cuccullata TaxID=36930 RepID=UPI002ED5970E
MRQPGSKIIFVGMTVTMKGMISLTLSVMLIMEMKFMVFFCITPGIAVQDNQNTTCLFNVSVPRASVTYFMDRCSRKTTTLGWWWKRKVVERYFNCVKTRKTINFITRQTFRCCEGYQNITGICTKLPCNSTTYGENCTLPCPCVAGQYHRCDANGSCFCSPGWMGDNCSEPCKSGKYGDKCQFECSCENNATCNHVTGNCDCSSVNGWTGEICQEECHGGFYGPNCSLPCNCSNFQDPVCHPVSGKCFCRSGKRGENCSLGCEMYNFGPDCAHTCDCFRNHSLYCNSSNGDCECKTGWVGEKCEQGCDPFHYGDDCSKNCPCDATEICDNENGTCSSANICFSEFSLNCLPSFMLTCEQLKEGCNANDDAELSLGKDMINICCESEYLLNTSLCIAEGDCKCRSGFSGKACNGTVLEEEDNKEFADQLKSGESSTVVATATVIPVLITTAVVVIVVLWRRKVGTNAKKEDNKTTHNPVYGKPALDTVTGQGSEQRAQEESQLEMNILNRDDVNNYGYDVSVRESRSKEKETYS